MIDSFYETSKELGRRLGVSDSHARKLMRTGRQPGIKRYNVWHVPRSKPNGHPNEDPWLFESVKEASMRLGVCKSTIRHWARDGVLEGYKVPGFRAWHIKKGAMPAHVCNASL